MYKRIKQYYKKWFNRTQEGVPVVVTFSGGMGAQMISAAIYFQMKLDGKAVFADLSYFDKPPETAEVGLKGKISQWGWQLTSFNLLPSNFSILNERSPGPIQIIKDGSQKLKLGLTALRHEKINSLFQIKGAIESSLPIAGAEKYLCIHVRRGDYVNVASHLVPDQAFYDLAERFSSLIAHVVIVSDSKIEAEFRAKFSALYSRVTCLDHIDEYQAHCVMRSASILVCSNSQFSLIAAILNKNGLVIIPKIWFDKEQHDLQAVFENLGDFQVLS